MSVNVCLETGPTGRCMAHMPEFPGCFSLAGSRDEALATVPEAVGSYIHWLTRHGESASMPESVEIAVTEEVNGYGPFERGDRAAIFTTDCRPLDDEEMERLLLLARYNRTDLLRTVEGLTDQQLDQQWISGAPTIRQILRHIGNTEQWYVSRIADPHTLPREWVNDDRLPIFEFLEMERRTAAERFRQLTPEECAATVYPARWTNHPEEGWTVRKALRRMLEHEREHYHHIRALLRGQTNRVSYW